MKKLIYMMLVLAMVSTTSCDDVLEVENLYGSELNNYYQTVDEIDAALVGVYNSLYVGGVHSNEHLAANLLSDLMLGGGGPDDVSAKNVDKFIDPNDDTYFDLWTNTYNGIFGANGIIENIDNLDASTEFASEADKEAYKAQVLGEAYFMRGFLLFRAAKFFGGMPLILTTDADRSAGRSTLTETYSVILSDFMTAINTLPNVPSTSLTIDDYGHANKWIAQGYLARAFLYYTGYMTNIENTQTSDIILMDGSTLNTAAVVAQLDDCMANSGYALLPDFRNLWPYSYVNQSAGTTVLPWAETEGLNWAGQDGRFSTIGTGNTESMFALRYGFGNWDGAWGQNKNNRIPLFFGIRDNSMIPFGQGWGWGPVHPGFYNSWDASDPRREGSVLELGNADQATDSYQADKGDHETGLVNKKYISLQHDGADDKAGMFYYIYNYTNHDMQLWHAQDFIYMRYADILLMHSELTQTATGLDMVRARAGLPASGGYSLPALKAERAYEFAFEGLRWFDLVRWGDVEDDAANYYDDEIDVRNSGVDVTYSVEYRAETKGLLPIPETEISLSKGSGDYTQNPGW